MSLQRRTYTYIHSPLEARSHKMSHKKSHKKIVTCYSCRLPTTSPTTSLRHLYSVSPAFLRISAKVSHPPLADVFARYAPENATADQYTPQPPIGKRRPAYYLIPTQNRYKTRAKRTQTDRRPKRPVSRAQPQDSGQFTPPASESRLPKSEIASE